MTANWDVNPQRATDRAVHRQDEHDPNGRLPRVYMLYLARIVWKQCALSCKRHLFAVKCLRERWGAATGVRIGHSTLPPLRRKPPYVIIGRAAMCEEGECPLAWNESATRSKVSYVSENKRVLFCFTCH